MNLCKYFHRIAAFTVLSAEKKRGLTISLNDVMIETEEISFNDIKEVDHAERTAEDPDRTAG